MQQMQSMSYKTPLAARLTTPSPPNTGHRTDWTGECLKGPLSFPWETRGGGGGWRGYCQDLEPDPWHHSKIKQANKQEWIKLKPSSPAVKDNNNILQKSIYLHFPPFSASSSHATCWHVAFWRALQCWSQGSRSGLTATRGQLLPHSTLTKRLSGSLVTSQEPPTRTGAAWGCRLWAIHLLHKQQALNKCLPNKYTPNDRVVVSTAPFGRQEKTPPPTDKDTDNKS